MSNNSRNTSESFSGNRKKSGSNIRYRGSKSFQAISPSINSTRNESCAICNKCGIPINIVNCTTQFEEILLNLQREQYNIEFSNIADDKCPLDEYIESLKNGNGLKLVDFLSIHELMSSYLGDSDDLKHSTMHFQSSGKLSSKADQITSSSSSSSYQDIRLAPITISEEVWENQWKDDLLKWSEDDLGMYPVLYSDFFGQVKSSHAMGVVKARTFNSHFDWITDWEVDNSFDGSDNGWIYSSSISNHCLEGTIPVRTVKRTTQESVDCLEKTIIAFRNLSSDDSKSKVRRRRMFRLRNYGKTITSWYIELVNCASMFSPVDYPICHSCESSVYNNLQDDLAQAQSDLVTNSKFLTDLETERILGFPLTYSASLPDDMKYLQNKTLEELQLEEQRLISLAQTYQQEWKNIRSKRYSYHELAKELQKLQDDAFASLSSSQLQQQESQEDLQATDMLAENTLATLKRLRRYNVYNDAFHIWHEGPFGTINNLKLGRLPSHPVEWNEINAALGQAALLLATIAEYAGLHFHTYRILPRGSFSKMACVDGREYPLYSDGSFLKRRGFNHALVWFLECTDEVGKMALNEEPNLQLPYAIQRGKIGELSICVGDDEEWTRALKYVLTHLKWLLAWIAKHNRENSIHKE